MYAFARGQNARMPPVNHLYCSRARGVLFGLHVLSAGLTLHTLQDTHVHVRNGHVIDTGTGIYWHARYFPWHVREPGICQMGRVRKVSRRQVDKMCGLCGNVPIVKYGSSETGFDMIREVRKWQTE